MRNIRKNINFSLWTKVEAAAGEEVEDTKQYDSLT